MSGARADSGDDSRAVADPATFAGLLRVLGEYPPYRYLRFARLTRNLAAASDTDIEEFLAAEPDDHLSLWLRRAYLQRLLDAGRWSDYARIYRPDGDVARQCLYLRARIETGRGAAIWPDVEMIWLNGHSRPPACDPVFAAWRKAGKLTDALIWQRLDLALAANQRGLARYLIGLFSSAQHAPKEQLLAALADSHRVADLANAGPAGIKQAPIRARAISELARRDPVVAAVALHRYQNWLDLDSVAADQARASVARALLRQGKRQGLAVWGELHATSANQPMQGERLRAALKWRDWKRVARWVEHMPEGAAKRERWRYWQARAEEALGHRHQARQLYQRVARERGLWGFMAAERLGYPYHFDYHPVPAEPQRIRRIAASAVFVRLRALQQVGDEAGIRRELRAFSADMGRHDLLALAYIADAMGWHDQAILILARTGYWDDLRLRFPLRYEGLVREQALANGIAPDWIFAVMRQESMFARSIASNAGAVGLMQLLPSTAYMLARHAGESQPSRLELLEPARNIALGSRYLARMQRRFGHLAVATAAYNAGPNRVARWLPEQPEEADLWIATIPYRETRDYVRRVLGYRVIYAERLGLGPLRLHELLPPVVAATSGG